RDRIRAGLARRAAKTDVAGADTDAWVDARLDRLRDVSSLDATARDAEVVIEAALEDLDAKRAIFRALDAAASVDTVLATNTSALSVTAIAAATTHPERVLGLHFFHPVPVMRLVELVVTSQVSRNVVARAEALVSGWGKTAVHCADTPGFIVNRVNRPYTIEALRLLESGEATVEEIDAAMRSAGFPMGPFELMDLVGIDVNLAAATGVWEGLGRPDHLRPSPIQAELVEAGRLGRKTGRGFYRYIDGRPDGVDVEPTLARRTAPRPGSIRDRIVAAVAAEARRVVRDGIATPGDVDLALRLGAGHPRKLVT
ncbi:MAG: 3-hydroxyacyl-CoA dehydrogenase family protein, partial [Candidatus Limnocylindrales bacterium]